jgi:hypothetical protein
MMAKTGWEENTAQSLHSNNQNLDKSKQRVFVCSVSSFMSGLFLFVDDQEVEGPSVDSHVLNNDGTTRNLDPKKATIGQRRPLATKKVRRFHGKFDVHKMMMSRF